ncbi:MAG: TetR family transcriptional regulator [Spirochaetes bacterium]|nr:TetR family transcriptional regulator [Spirochaetota bacterium]
MEETHKAKFLILKAAFDEISEVGVGNARTSSIAKRAGVASGLLHYYYGTKENLIKEIIDHLTNPYQLNDITVIPYHRSCTPVEKIQVILYTILEYTFKNTSQNIIKFYHRIMAEGKIVRNLITNKHILFAERYIIKIIEQGNKEKMFYVKYPFYFTLELTQTAFDQISLYSILEGTPEEKEFFPSPFYKTYSEHYINTALKQIMKPDKLNHISKIPDDLMRTIDTYIAVSSNREIIGSYDAIILLIAKLFNDEHLLTGEH